MIQRDFIAAFRHQAIRIVVFARYGRAAVLVPHINKVEEINIIWDDIIQL